jgi:hypothetical protein
MAQRIRSRQTAIYELTKEDLEACLCGLLCDKTGEELPFEPNKITVQLSDPANGVYQIRIEYNDDLPQVLPLREGIR